MESKALVSFEETTVLAAFTAKDGLEPFIDQAKAIVSGFEHDLSTGVGRAKTASLAAKVATLKVKLDDHGKDLVLDWKTKAKAVDKHRKSMRDALDELKVEARKPLTDWEDEQTRLEAERAATEAAEKLQREKESDHEMGLLLDEKITREREEMAAVVERERVAALDKIKREAAEAATAEAEILAKVESDRLLQEKADADERAAESERQRIAAVESARINAENAETERLKVIEDAMLAKVKAQKDAVEAEIKAKKDAEDAAENARLLQVKAQADKEAKEREEAAVREANKKHVGSVRKEAKEALMALGLDDAMAKKVVLAIHAANIPNVLIKY
jgi:colicin import membrane protein